jgi:hypothetical protein
MTQCNTKTRVDFHPDFPVDVTFDAPEMSSDGGWTLLRQTDERLGLCQMLAEAVPDERQAAKVDHSRLEQLRQRVYQLAMGHEDCLDADRLREDRLLKTVCGKAPEGKALSSQPTLSLLENAVDLSSIFEMLLVLEYRWIQSLDEDREVVILDVDSSAFEAHGQQELIAYDKYHGEHIYHPLLVFDGHDGQLVTAILRAGDVGDSRGAPEYLDRLIGRIKAVRPDLDVVVRGDANFAKPRQYQTIEEIDEVCGGAEYLLGIARNSVLEEKLAETMEAAVETYEETGEKTRKFVGFEYQAGSWDRPRYVVGKAEVGPEGKNPRFVIGGFREFPPEMIYRGYCERGESEQWVDGFKNQVSAQRLSCSSFEANFFRVVLAAAAYRLLQGVTSTLRAAAEEVDEELEEDAEELDDEALERKRRTLSRLRTLARAEFTTLRERLLKVGTIVHQSTRRIHLEMPRWFPNRGAFRRALCYLKRGPPG